nr:hypothetical protein 2 [Alphaproteobacteria bacterium]
MFRLTFSEIVAIVFMVVAMAFGFFSIAALVWWLYFLHILFADLDEEDREIAWALKPICALSVFLIFLSGWFGPEDAITMNRILGQ